MILGLVMVLVTMAGEHMMAQVEQMSIRPGVELQTITGFGASLAYYENWLTAHPKKDLIYKVIFGELGLDILRVRNAYQYDPAMVGRVREFIEEAEAVRGTPIPLLSTSWGPPGPLKNTGDRTNGGTLRYTTGPGGVEFDYPGFADWWMGALDEYAANGIFPTWISIQNEPSFKESWETCILRPAEVVNASDTLAGYDRALDAVYDTLVKRDHVPLILGPEVLGIGYNLLENYVNELDLSKIDVLGHHLYHGVDVEDPWASTDFGKVGKFHPEVPHFQSEFSGGDWFSLAGVMYKSFNDERVTAYLYWDLVWEHGGLVTLENPWNQGSWDTSSGYVKTKDFFTFKQFSAFVDPGWKLVELEVTGDDPRALAFVSPDRDSMACVVINRSETRTLSIRVGLEGYRVAGSYVYETSEDNNCEKVSRLRDSVLTIPPRSVNTVEMQLVPYDPLEDTVAPSVPTSPRVTGVGETEIHIAWEASTDDMGVAHYRLYLDGDFAGTTHATSYSFGELVPGTTYKLSVTAVDDAGNESGEAGPLTGTTLFFDREPPTLEATDSIHVEGILVVTSSEEGVVYLVPGGTNSELAAIIEASIDSAEVLAGIAVEIPVTGLDNGVYWLYARDTACNISELEEVVLFGVGIAPDGKPGCRVFPNPMERAAVLEITLVEEGPLWLMLFDSKGRVARTESLGRFPAGNHEVILERRGLKEGLYLFRIAGQGGTAMHGRLVIGR